MVDRARPRKVPQWQAPTRPAHYPRQSTISKDYNVENIADLSMPKADQRIIRLDEKYADHLDTLEQEMAYYMNMMGPADLAMPAAYGKPSLGRKLSQTYGQATGEFPPIWE